MASIVPIRSSFSGRANLELTVFFRKECTCSLNAIKNYVPLGLAKIDTAVVVNICRTTGYSVRRELFAIDTDSAYQYIA
jgi:hypothetical protein